MLSWLLREYFKSSPPICRYWFLLLHCSRTPWRGSCKVSTVARLEATRYLPCMKPGALATYCDHSEATSLGRACWKYPRCGVWRTNGFLQITCSHRVDGIAYRIPKKHLAGSGGAFRNKRSNIRHSREMGRQTLCHEALVLGER